MTFALLALMQSALACGPYGASAFSDDGSWAFEDGDVVAMYDTEGDRTELPIYGEVLDIDFLGDDLLVAYLDAGGSFVIRFDGDGRELREWSPLRDDMVIRSVWVLEEGVLVTTVSEDERARHFLNDDLRRWSGVRPSFTPKR